VRIYQKQKKIILCLILADIRELENIREKKYQIILKHFIDLEITEKISCILCRKYYIVMGKNSEYTRINGLPRGYKYKTLLLQRIENYGKGCLKELVIFCLICL
jgi:hypothetical protein